MKPTHVPVNTPFGALHGRDVIYLDDMRVGRGVLRLTGEFNGHLFSEPQEKFIRYRLTFSGLVAFSMVALDACPEFGASSFDEILNSGWVREIGGGAERDVIDCGKLRHFFVQTYDDVFNVVCRGYDLRVEPAAPANDGVHPAAGAHLVI